MAKIIVKIFNPAMTTQNCEDRFYSRALPKVADRILSDCNTYVRMQDGTLANSARSENGGRQIRWRTSYAKKVYHTGTPRKNVNPNASLRWCEVAKRKYSKEWADMATSLVNGG